MVELKQTISEGFQILRHDLQEYISAAPRSSLPADAPADEAEDSNSEDFELNPRPPSPVTRRRPPSQNARKVCVTYAAVSTCLPYQIDKARLRRWKLGTLHIATCCSKPRREMSKRF